MSLSVQRLAAAQSHARNRAEQTAYDQMMAQQGYQNAIATDQYMRDRRKRRTGGAINTALGAAIGGAGAFMGNPMMIGAGASMAGSGVAQIAGSPELASTLPMLGSIAGQGVAQYQSNNAAAALAADLQNAQLEQQQTRAQVMNDAMGYGQYEQNLMPLDEYERRMGGRGTPMDFAGSMPRLEFNF